MTFLYDAAFVLSWYVQHITVISYGHDDVSNHQPHDCLLNRLFRRRSKKTSRLRVAGLCVGNSPGPVNSPRKWPVTRKMFPFDDVIMSGHQFQMYAMLKLSFAVWTVILSEIGLKVIFSSHKSIVRIFYANRDLYVTNGSPWGQLLVTISVSFIFVLQGL